MSKTLEFLADEGPIARRLEGFEARPEQRELAVAVERALHDKKHLLAEAGTGIGKSFAYLLPAVLHAESHRGDGPVVISTRTIALQQQLDQKDLPFLAAVLPTEFSAVTAVGRNNYLCLRRMHMARGEQQLFDQEETANELEQIVQWSATTQEGTRMSLPFQPLPQVWEAVQAEHGNCLNKACKFYDPCKWQRARRRMEGADILVVNHSLYMADIALRMAGANALPRHRVVIFDEAHHLERVATESLGLSLAESTVGWHLRRLLPKRAAKSLLATYGTSESRLLVEDLRIANEAFFADLTERLAMRRNEAMPLNDETLLDPVSPLLKQLASEVAAAAVRGKDLNVRMELTARAQGLDGLAATFKALTSGAFAGPMDDREDAHDPELAVQSAPTTMVRWIEPHRRGPTLRAAPLEVAGALREWMFGSGATAVLVSATLGIQSASRGDARAVDDDEEEDGSFAPVKQGLGIDKATTLRLGSPFNYDAHVDLVLEEAMPDPGGDVQGFDRAVAQRTESHVLDNGGRALILCTSWRQVNALAESLRDPLADAGISLLVQGEDHLAQLLERKRKEPASVLLGTDTLWEGIDVPGDALTLVVLTRFPFASPGHPLTKARHRLIEQRGGNSFMDLTLPAAILKFRQGFGRLVRRSSDRGKVIVMDPRVRTKRYGRTFLASLPFAELR